MDGSITECDIESARSPDYGRIDAADGAKRRLFKLEQPAGIMAAAGNTFNQQTGYKCSWS